MGQMLPFALLKQARACLLHHFVFLMPSQEELRSFWLQAPDGKLCGREQAKAWALREVWRAEGKGDWGMYTFIAGKVKKMFQEEPNGASPSVPSIKEFFKEFFKKVDGDPNWFPGKASDTKRSPKRILRGSKVTAIASAAKRIKAEGEEPT